MFRERRLGLHGFIASIDANGNEIWSVIDEKGHQYVLVLIDAFSRRVKYIRPKELLLMKQPSAFSSIWVELGHLNESSLIVAQSFTKN